MRRTWIVALMVVLQSCKKDSPINDPGYSYFPDNVGHYCIYAVDSTVYRSFFGDTVHYKWQLKEQIQSYFTDNEGRKAMRVEQYTRPYIDSIPYDSLPWTLFRVVSFTLTNTTAERYEDNQRFIRLAFVPRTGKRWNGNAYNTIGDWQYEYLSVDEPYSINSLSFDSTLLVEEKLDTNKISYQIYTERYARRVGLIERTVIDVKDTSLCCGSVLNRIYSGVISSVKLVSWGD